MQPLPEKHIIALKSHIKERIEQKKHNPSIVTVNETNYVIKTKRREQGRTWREYASALTCLMLFNEMVRPKHLRTGCVQHEANRLRELSKLNINVPKLFLEDHNYIVMEYCGEPVEFYLQNTPNNTDLFLAITEELIALHSANQWHGGAQVRNLTLSNGKIYRIDFEENTGNAMSLHLAQTYDVLLCFNSLTPYWIDKHDLALDMLKHYLQSVNNPNINEALMLVSKHLKRIKKILPILRAKTKQKNDIQHTMFFLSVLEESMKLKMENKQVTFSK